MRRNWKLVAALTLPPTLCLGFAGWAAWGFITFLNEPDPFTTEGTVSCAEAMLYADQSGLPTGAHDARCEVKTRLDTTYDVTFRISRPSLDSWLASAYPGTILRSVCYPDSIDACAHIELDPPAHRGAIAIDVTVEYEDANTALVELMPFDV